MTIDSKLITYNDLERLYNSGKSMFEISQIYGCSPNKVVYWMRKYNISRRSRSDSAYVKQNPLGDPFKIKTRLAKADAFLYGLGLGIFWGEGSKSPQISSLRVANTDPDLIRTFRDFLVTIYGLSEKRFSYSIVCFNDIGPDVARAYWASQLKILPERFGKITTIPVQGKGTYRKKSQYGVCTIQGNNVKLQKLVFEQIDKIRRKYMKVA